ncbi:MAG: response regulator [Proteobacteria bacterium]|nr:MAG: response regulator [Pseudomonadota bacterium]
MKKTVLVVEPDHDARVEIRETLEREGYLVVSTANGTDAYNLLLEIHQPTLILLSCNPALLHRERFLARLGMSPALNAVPVLHLLRTSDLKQVLAERSF